MDLNNIDVQLDDEDLAIMLMCSLPPKYKNFREIVLYGREEITLEDVKTALLQRELIENQLSGKAQNSQGDQGLVVKGNVGNSSRRERSRSRSRNKGKGILCYGCHKHGHIKRNCPERGDNSDDSTGDGTATVAREDSDGDVLMASEPGMSTDRWVLDSGCSYHVCPKRSWFSTYDAVDPLHGGAVVLGNGDTCKIAGVGTVRIRMFDGHVRMLTGVRHVPEMKKKPDLVKCLGR